MILKEIKYWFAELQEGVLRDYQIDSASAVVEALERCRAVLVQMPTGAGKTHVFCSLIRYYRQLPGFRQKILVLAHRKELIQQIRDRLERFGIASGEISAGIVYNANAQVQVGSVQSLLRESRRPLNVGLIVVDEAHHTPADSYMNIIFS